MAEPEHGGGDPNAVDRAAVPAESEARGLAADGDTVRVCGMRFRLS